MFIYGWLSFPLTWKSECFDLGNSQKSEVNSMVLPLLKLGTLAVKTLSKPVANKLKQQATNYPKFRHFIVSIAQANHRLTTQMQRRIYSHSTDVEIRPLDEQKAVQAAVDLMGDIFVFMVAGAVVIFEVQRSAKSEARKEEMRKQEFEAMRQRDEELAKEVEFLRHKLDEIDQLARGRGLGGFFHLKHSNTETVKVANPT
ncbi:hypothetical protein K2173_001626 [Erythroxylum novogranatense]|uniref:OPA3-like protein n=1 Tax=Erythroxylum novogranatense TaxID=1862640 RepID=A0AAV8T496_9ROSI|nr:hypothetical protein K2173_001626 [Erythroxylum novogranatense]